MFNKTKERITASKEGIKKVTNDIKNIPNIISELDGDQTKIVFIAVPIMLIIAFGITWLLSSISEIAYAIFLVIIAIVYLYMRKRNG